MNNFESFPKETNEGEKNFTRNIAEESKEFYQEKSVFKAKDTPPKYQSSKLEAEDIASMADSTYEAALKKKRARLEEIRSYFEQPDDTKVSLNIPKIEDLSEEEARLEKEIEQIEFLMTNPNPNLN